MGQQRDHYAITKRGIVYFCDICGKFVSPQGDGVSWSQTWSYSFPDGEPDLHDPVYRCSPCTDRHGIRATNCGNPHLYRGRNQFTPIERETPNG